MGLRKIVVLCLIGMGMFLFTGSASAQTGVSYTIDPTFGPVGTPITFAGSGCPQETDPTVTRAEVRFEVFATVGAGVSQGSFIAFGGAHSNPDGTFSGTTTISADAELGIHQTQIVCTGGVKQGQTFNVIAEPSTTTTSSTSTTVAPVITSTSVVPSTTVPATSSTTVPTTYDQSSATTAPTTISSTSQLYGVQGTDTTTNDSLALTGFDSIRLVLIALSIFCFGVAFVLTSYCPWFPQFEDKIRRFGRAFADLFVPTPLQ